MPEETRLLVPVDLDGDRVLVFDPGQTGWAIVWSGESWIEDNQMLRVRFAPTVDEPGAPIVIQEIWVSGQSMSGRSLRHLPLSRLEDAVNMPGIVDDVRAALMPTDAFSVPYPEPTWTDDDQRAGWDTVPPAKDATKRGRPGLKLSIPKGYGRPDSFYRDVARVYSLTNLISRRPANDIAEANDVPVTTVHGWVKEARKRGFLAPRDRKVERNRDAVLDWMEKSKQRQAASEQGDKG
jgi:hypothetical protein